MPGGATRRSSSRSSRGRDPLPLDRYREVAPELLGDAPEARIVWDQLVSLLDDWVARPERRGDLARLRRYGASAGCWTQIG